LAAQVGIQESHPLVLAICFIWDLESQVIEPTADAVAPSIS
jgi:hypothetical protein